MLWNWVNVPTGKSSGKGGGEIKVIIIIWDETLKVWGDGGSYKKYIDACMGMLKDRIERNAANVSIHENMIDRKP